MNGTLDYCILGYTQFLGFIFFFLENFNLNIIKFKSNFLPKLWPTIPFTELVKVIQKKRGGGKNAMCVN